MSLTSPDERGAYLLRYAVIIALFAIGCFAFLGWDPFLLTFLVPGTLLSLAAALMRRQPAPVPA